MEKEFVRVEMIIEKIFDGSAMEFRVLSTSGELSEKFLKVLREDYDIDVYEYSGIVNPLDEELVEESEG